MAKNYSPEPKQRNPSKNDNEKSPNALVKFLQNHVSGNGYSDLEKKGIMQLNSVFGNQLEKIRKFGEFDPKCQGMERELPEFLVRAIRKIESLKPWSAGLYRVPGEAHKILAIKNEVDNGKYNEFDKCKDVFVLTSAVKLFFRDLKDPLIPQDVRDVLVEAQPGAPVHETSKLLQDGIDHLDTLNRYTLTYFMAHLKRVERDKVTLMDADALGTVISPNLMHSCSEAVKRPISLIGDIQMNNRIVSLLVEHHDRVFDPFTPDPGLSQPKWR